MLWALPISPVLFDEVSKIVFARALGVQIESDLAEYYLTEHRFYISCILYISASLVFPVEIPAGWETLATQSLVIIRTTNREFDSELFYK